MKAEKAQLNTLEEVRETIDKIGARNSEMMAARGVYANILVRDAPGSLARLLKRHYNDVGGEVALSYNVWLEKEGAMTDILVMGSLHQHGEVRAALGTIPEIRDLLKAIKSALD